MRVLITCGATWTPIDDVRVISNVSSGEMGHLIAQAFLDNGAFVTIIEGPVTHTLVDKKIKIIKYRFFDELARVLSQELLKKYDIIIHAAAVSDFKVIGPLRSKISSDKAVTLKLAATPKLIKDIKHLNPESFLVGFKLEPNLNPKNIFKTVKSLFTQAGCDLVVANTLTGGYRGFILNAEGAILAKAADKKALAQSLVKSVIASVAKQSFVIPA
jgi:phosphopantothenoylcysteine decarboxylase/phosphopantothenate--cysteine ligase